jgi:hypothetical protein
MVDSKILVNQAVSHTSHIFPWNLRVCLFKLARYFAGCLTDDFEISYHSIHPHFVAHELIDIRAVQIFKSAPGCDQNVQQIRIVTPQDCSTSSKP